MTDEQRKQFIEEQIEIFPADCEMGEFLRDMAKLQPCEDAISRSEAIRIASGYCHWTNIPTELAKLPSVNPKPCEDTISRKAAIDAVRWGQSYISMFAPDGTVYHPYECENDALEDAVDRIAELPPVTPTQNVCEDAISRQAAIGIIQNWLNFEGYSWGEKNVMKCTINELRYLPSVSAEKTAIDCSDSICRADAIKLVKSYIHEIITESGVDKNSHTNKILTDIVESLAFELSPVSVAKKTGRWKRISIDKYSEHSKYWYRCDKCGKDNLGNTDWCPNCGCRMVEPQPYKAERDE